jgi:hypothetical protein
VWWDDVSLCKKRTWGVAWGWFTQSKSKSSVRDGGLSGMGGRRAPGAGTTRIRIATEALRCSGR